MAISEQEQVERIISDDAVLQQWGITQARRASRVAYVVFLVAIAATALLSGTYIALGDQSLVWVNSMGLFFILVMAIVTAVLRFFQIKAQRADIERFVPFLRRRLTGDPQTDAQAQVAAETEFEWKSRSYLIVIRMIELAMVVLIAVNTYQSITVDMWRQFVYDGCIAIAIAGFAWNQFLLRSELLYEELVVRTEATVRYQNSPAYREALEQAAEEDDWE